MAISKLTEKFIKTAPAGKHDDGDGLRLFVRKTGTKQWVYRFTLEGKRRELGLGGLTKLSAAEARKRRDNVKQGIKDGIDPFDKPEPEPVKITIPSFRECAAAYIDRQRPSWANKKHAQQWTNTLETYAHPRIGDKLVDSITLDDVVSIHG